MAKGHSALYSAPRYSWSGLVVAALAGALLITACGQAHPAATTCVQAACTPATGGGDILPEWSVNWNPAPGGIAAGVIVDAALQQGLQRIQTTVDPATGAIERRATPLPAQAISWLATSQTFGVALVRSDPAGTQFVVYFLTVAPGSAIWNATWLGAGSEGHNCPGTAAGGTVSGLPALAIPGAPCASRTTATAPPAPYYAFDVWTTADAVYLRADLHGPVARPASSVPVSFAGMSGWQDQDNGITTFALPRAADDADLFACSVAAADCRELAVTAFTAPA